DLRLRVLWSFALHVARRIVRAVLDDRRGGGGQRVGGIERDSSERERDTESCDHDAPHDCPPAVARSRRWTSCRPPLSRCCLEAVTEAGGRRNRFLLRSASPWLVASKSDDRHGADGARVGLTAAQNAAVFCLRPGDEAVIRPSPARDAISQRAFTFLEKEKTSMRFVVPGCSRRVPVAAALTAIALGGAVTFAAITDAHRRDHQPLPDG